MARFMILCNRCKLSIYSAMKTYLLTLILIAGLSAASPGKPINDIYSVKEPALEEESYVNDIRFNTRMIASEALLDGYETRLEEEANVNDIPFDTRKVACKYLFCKMMATLHEPEVDDIPFNTETIFRDCMVDRMTNGYRQERDVRDISFDTRTIASVSLLEEATIHFRDEEETFDLPAFREAYHACNMIMPEPSQIWVLVKSSKKSNGKSIRLKKSDYTIIYPVRIEIPRMEQSFDYYLKEISVSPVLSL